MRVIFRIHCSTGGAGAGSDGHDIDEVAEKGDRPKPPNVAEMLAHVSNLFPPSLLPLFLLLLLLPLSSLLSPPLNLAYSSNAHTL